MKKIILLVFIFCSHSVLSEAVIESRSNSQSCSLKSMPEQFIKTTYLSCQGVQKKSDFGPEKNVSFDIKIKNYIPLQSLSSEKKSPNKFEDYISIMSAIEESCILDLGITELEFINLPIILDGGLSSKDCMANDDYFHCNRSERIDGEQSHLNAYVYRKTGKYTFFHFANRVKPSYYQNHEGFCKVIENKNKF